MSRAIADGTFNDRMVAFCVEYLKDFNGAAACERAGYSKKGARQQAVRLLSNANIQARLSKLAQKQMEAAEVEVGEVIRAWKELAFNTMDDFLDLDASGLPVVNLSRAKGTSKMRQIRKVSQRILKTLGGKDEGDPLMQVIAVDLEIRDSARGLEALSKYFKLYADGLPDGSGDAPADPEAARTRTFETLERYIVGDDAFLEGLAAVFARHRRRLDQLNLLAKGK